MAGTVISAFPAISALKINRVPIELPSRRDASAERGRSAVIEADRIAGIDEDAKVTGEDRRFRTRRRIFAPAPVCRSPRSSPYRLRAWRIEQQKIDLFDLVCRQEPFDSLVDDLYVREAGIFDILFCKIMWTPCFPRQRSPCQTCEPAAAGK